MKRLTFKAEHKPKVLAGTKRFTSRWRDLKLNVGETVAAVSAQNGRPAFLVPASDAFAKVLIESVEKKLWRDFTEEDAAKCGVTRAWYLKERPNAKDTDEIFNYGFWVIAGGNS